MPQAYVWVGAAVLGVVAAVAAIIIEIRQRQQNGNHRSPESICCICGQRISENPYTSACGHRFHRQCYADKLLEHRDRGGGSRMCCPSCGYSSRKTESLSGGVRRRNTLRRNSDAASNSSRNDNGSANENNKCGYCSRNVTEQLGEVDKLDCGHNAHHDCRINLEQLITCVHCVSKRCGNPKDNKDHISPDDDLHPRLSSGKCSNCDIPFSTSDRNKKQRDCGHLVHDKCSGISQFTICTNCPRNEEAS